MTFITQRLNACDLDGGFPILCTRAAMAELDCDDVLMVSVNDVESIDDLETFCIESGNELLQRIDCGDECTLLIAKRCSESAVVLEFAEGRDRCRHQLIGRNPDRKSPLHEARQTLFRNGSQQCQEQRQSR